MTELKKHSTKELAIRPLESFGGVNPLRISRLLGAITLLINLFLLILAIAGLLASDSSKQLPFLLPTFALIFVIYAVFSSLLIIFLAQAFTRANDYQTTLQTVLTSYERRTEELQVAATIARDASAETNLQDVLNRAASLVGERFGFYHVAIFLIEQEGMDKNAVMRAGIGTAASSQLLASGHRLAVGSQSIIGYVTATGKARVVLDVQQDKTHRANPLLQLTRSEMAVPLRVGETVIGALDVQSTEEGAFSQEDVMILQTLADLLAVLIHKTELNDQVAQYAIHLEERVEQRAAELNRERAQLNAILDAMREGVVFFEDDKLRYTNRAFTSLTGYSAQDWMGFSSLLQHQALNEDEAETLRSEITQNVNQDGFWRGERRLRRKNGGEFEAHITTVLIQSEEQRGVVTIIRDISQEKALQEQQNRFVAYASHELRTPLANMKTRLYLLQRQRNQFDKHFEVMQAVVGRMQRLVDDLLTQSRMERGIITMSRSVQSLDIIVGDVVEMQQDEAANRQQSLILQTPETGLKALIDNDRMTQVITNIVGNAINYTPEGGHISVSLRKVDYDFADILVQDNGVGIPMEAIDQVFLPFFRASNTTSSGTGLGLNIAKQIVEMHGGEILVESEENKGTTFTIRLPLAENGVLA
jgi:PAS domain S-box-containing protein